MSDNTQETASENVKAPKAAKAVKAPKEKVKVSIPQVLGWLKEGKDRREIAKILGLNFTQLKALFKHKDLIGKKVHNNRTDAFEIVEELPEGESDNASEITQATVSEAPVAPIAEPTDNSGW